jgi:hypothetical protein
MTNTVQDAYRIVFNDMMNRGVSMFVGTYDAKNGSEQFMYGVSLVMDWIAYNVNAETGDHFSDLFTANMLKSEQKKNKKYLKKRVDNPQ